MRDQKRNAEVQYSTSGARPIVELIVPHNARLKDVIKVQDTLSKELLPKLTPRGCLPCISGCHFVIRERLEHVINVELGSGKILGG